MQLIFMGCSDEHGVPRVGCDCEVCQSANLPGSRNNRTGPSMAVHYGPSYAERLVLIDAAPEFRLQATREKLRRFDALLLTHAHDAHLLGLSALLSAQREVGQPLPIYAPSQVLNDAQDRLGYLWQEKSYRRILQPEPMKGPVDLWGLEVQALRVDHGLGGAAYGYRLSFDGQKIAYVSDMLRATAEVRQSLAGLDLLVLGASHYYEGIEMWKRSVMDIVAAIELIHEVAPARSILTHLSHTVDHDDIAARLPETTMLAYDGLLVEVGA